jgi:hypothetical protein
MHWEFDAMPVWRHPTTITIRQSEDNEKVEITHRNCNAAHRTLAVMMNPAGTQKAEAERLLEKGKKIATKVQAGCLPRHYAHGVVYWSIGVFTCRECGTVYH